MKYPAFLLLFSCFLTKAAAQPQPRYTVRLADTIKYEQVSLTQDANYNSWDYVMSVLKLDIGNIRAGSAEDIRLLVYPLKEPMTVQHAVWGEPDVSPEYPREPMAPKRNGQLLIHFPGGMVYAGRYKTKRVAFDTNLGRIEAEATAFVLPEGITANSQAYHAGARTGIPLRDTFTIANSTDSTFLFGNYSIATDLRIIKMLPDEGEALPAHSTRQIIFEFTPRKAGTFCKQFTTALGSFRVRGWAVKR